MADALAVADLLKANVPAAPSQSLAAGGGLWAALESTIAATPQEKALPVPVRAPKPRLQQFGQWLATPGALPFGAVAAAAFVGMIWVHQQSGVPTEPSKAVSVAASDSAAPAEISLVPSPASPKAMAPAASSAKVSGQIQARSAPIAVATNSESDDSEIVPLKRSLAIRPLSVASPHRAAPATVRTSAPRAPIQIAKASQSDSVPSASSMFAAPTPPTSAAAPALPKMAVLASPAPSPSASDGFSGVQPGGAGAFGGGGAPAMDRALPPAPIAQMARVMPAPALTANTAASAMSTQKPEAFGAMPSSGAFVYKSEETQDASLGHSLTDMALQQRRKRTLFSYATR